MFKKFTPGMIDVRQAMILNQLIAKVDRLDEMVNTQDVGAPVFKKFQAKITAVDGSTPEKYSYTEQFFIPATGLYEDKVNGRIGTTTDMWAYERNGIVATSFPFYAEVTERCRVDGTVVLEFDAPGISQLCDISSYVTNVCPTFGLLTMVDGTLYLDGVAIDDHGLPVMIGLQTQNTNCAGETDCNPNPVGCCTDCVCPCCEERGNSFPNTLYLTVSNITTSPGPECSWINGHTSATLTRRPWINIATPTTKLWASDWTDATGFLVAGNFSSGGLIRWVVLCGGDAPGVWDAGIELLFPGDEWKAPLIDAGLIDSSGYIILLTADQDSITCDPLDIEWTGASQSVDVPSHCDITFDLTVTE